MTKEDPLKILATDKKKESNEINKMDDVYMVIYMSLYTKTGET